MAREKATPKSTGGGGFTFADKVAAAFLGRPLRRDLILGADVAPIAEIDLETRESGNLLRGEGGGAKGSRVSPCAVLAQ